MKPTRDGKNRRPQKNSGFSLQKKGETYEIRIGKKVMTIFNPETCLKVGRHYRKLGVVYVAPSQKQKWISSYWSCEDVTYHKTERGLVKWDGIDPKSLAFGSIKIAIEMSGLLNPPKWMVDKIVETMNLDKLWEDLTFRTGLGKELEAVQEVMEI